MESRLQYIIRNKVLLTLFLVGSVAGFLLIFTLDYQLSHDHKSIIHGFDSKRILLWTLGVLFFGTLFSYMYKFSTEKDRVEEINKEKSIIMNITSHELKTPLVPIILKVELLQKGAYGKLGKKQSQAINVIYKNMLRLRLLIFNMLDLARVETGKVSVIKKKVDLVKIAKHAVRTFQNNYSESKIKIKIKSRKSLKIEADEHRITQVFMNVISNAQKYAKKIIRISIAKEGSYSIISFEDDGKGISPEDRKRLFKPFSQIDDSSTISPSKGTGLGLFISKRFIELHNGTISFENSEDLGGAKVSVKIPICEVTEVLK